MERGSDTHGPRLDDALKHETEGLVHAGHGTHAEEWKDPEASGEDQPDADLDPAGTLAGGTPPGMDEVDVEQRSELARWLTRAAFPGDRDALSGTARDNGAPDAVLATLAELPAGQTFDNVQQAWAALGGSVETERS